MMKKLCCVLLIALVACAEKRPPDEVRLEKAASLAARFLAGYESFATLDLADSVDLYVAPDGGGGQARFAREQLRDPQAWRVKSGRVDQSFLPHGIRTRLVASVGHYMNCTPSELKTRFPALAAHPHVGVKLEPANAKSCLESWNATFVYDTTGGRARLIAAIYDQWEW